MISSEKRPMTRRNRKKRGSRDGRLCLSNILKKAGELEKELGIVAVLAVPHPVYPKYRGMRCKLTATSGQHHAECLLTGYIKSRAIGNGLIPLSFEDGILPVVFSDDEECQIHPDIVVDMNKARHNVENILKQNPPKNSEALQRMLVADRDVWAPHDRFFGIEISFAAAAGTDEGARMFVARLFAVMPQGVSRFVWEPFALHIAYF